MLATDLRTDPWHHFERTADGFTALTRTEHFAHAHKGMEALLMGGSSAVGAAVAGVVGEPVTLYKEKINMKAPGGAGYAAHQDAPAYRELSKHVTCLAAIDGMDEGNGCLEFAAGRWEELYGCTEDGIIEPALAVRPRPAAGSQAGCRSSAAMQAELQWTPCPLEPGDLLVFSSYAPHRSGPNRSGRPRRAIYCTYNLASEGDLRKQYYANKAESMGHDRWAPPAGRRRAGPHAPAASR